MRRYKKDTMEWYEMRKRVYRYLKEECLVGYYPNLIKIESSLKIFSVRDKSLFYEILDYLEEYKIILFHTCEDGVERVILHPRLGLSELSAKMFGDKIE